MAEKRELSEGIENIDPNAVKKRRLSLSLKKNGAVVLGLLPKNNSNPCFCIRCQKIRLLAVGGLSKT